MAATTSLTDDELIAISKELILSQEVNVGTVLLQYLRGKYTDDEHKLQSSVDLFMSIIRYSQQQLYRANKLSAALRSVAVPWTICISTPHDNFQEALLAFEAKVVSYSVHRPPLSESIFSLDQAQHFVEFVTRTFFAHYKLYKFVNTKLPRCDLQLQVEGSTLSSSSSPSSMELTVNRLQAQEMQPEAEVW
jgi:hypothetical protein